MDGSRFKNFAGSILGFGKKAREKIVQVSDNIEKKIGEKNILGKQSKKNSLVEPYMDQLDQEYAMVDDAQVEEAKTQEKK